MWLLFVVTRTCPVGYQLWILVINISTVPDRPKPPECKRSRYTKFDSLYSHFADLDALRFHDGRHERVLEVQSSTGPTGCAHFTIACSTRCSYNYIWLQFVVTPAHSRYRGTSLIRNSPPPLGPQYGLRQRPTVRS